MIRFFSKYLWVSYSHERGFGWMMFDKKIATQKITHKLIMELQAQINKTENVSSCLIINWKRVY